MEHDSCAFHCDYPPPHEDLDPGCQFRDEMTFFDCGGKGYCRFHLPMANDDGHPTEKVSWLEAGEAGHHLNAFRKTLEAYINAALEDDSLANFSGVVFPGDTDFTTRPFPDVLWYRARFHGEAEFRLTDFRGVAYFEYADFQRRPDFRNASFKDVDFRNTKFPSGAHFEDAKFQTAHFENAKIQEDIRFCNAQFQAARFGNAEFVGADFRNAEFLYADFQDAEFMDADFRNAEFHGRADFGNAKLLDADFQDAKFQGITDFQDVEFHGSTDFQDAEFQGPAVFENAEFVDVDYTNAKFSAVTNFQGSCFRNAPLFHNAPLHQDTRFNPGDRIAEQFPNIVDGLSEQAYRTLKLHMIANHAHREEQFFFRLEMKARAKHERWWRRILYNVYDFFSDYGHNIARPLGWWLVLLLWMTGVQAAASSKVAKAADIFALTCSDWMAAGTVAASNALPIGGFARQGLAEAVKVLYPQGIPAWLPIFSILHTVLSGVLLFLAVLALRNLFKMK